MAALLMTAAGIAAPPRLDVSAPPAVGIGAPAALVATPSQGLGVGERVEWTLIENAAGSGRLRLAGAVGGDGTRVTAHGLSPGVVTVRAAVRDARGRIRLQSDPASVTVVEAAVTVAGAPWAEATMVSVPVRVRPRGAPVANVAVGLHDAAGALLASATVSATALQADPSDPTADVVTVTLAVPAGAASPRPATVVAQALLAAGGAATHATPVRVHPPASPLLSITVQAATLTATPGTTVAVPIVLATSQHGGTTLAASWGPATTTVNLTAQLASLAPFGSGQFQGTVTVPAPASAGRYTLTLAAALGVERADATVAIVVAPNPLPGTALRFDAASASARQGEVFEHRFSLAPGLMASLTAPLAWRLVDPAGATVCYGTSPLPAASAASPACRGAVRFRAPRRLGRQMQTFRLELSGTLPDGTQILDSASVSIAGEPAGPLTVTIIEPAANTSTIEGTSLHVGFTLGPLAATATVEGVMVTLTDAGTGALLVGQSVPAGAFVTFGDGVFGTASVPILAGFSGADGGTGRTVLTVTAIEQGTPTVADTVGVTVFAAPTLSVVSPSPLTLREGSASTITVAISPEVVTVTSFAFTLQTSDGAQTLATGTLPGGAFTVVGGTVQASFTVPPPSGSAALSASVGTQFLLTALVQESPVPVTLTTGVTILSPAPTIASIAPSVGMPGTTITITGSGFDATVGATTITFTPRADPGGAVTLTPSTVNASGTSLAVVLSGAVLSGLNDVVVTVSSVSSSPATFVVTTPDGLITTSGILDRLRTGLANTNAAASRNAIHAALNALGSVEALWADDRWQRGFEELLVAENALAAAAAGGDSILVLLHDEFVRFMLDVTIAVLEFWRQAEKDTGLSFPLTDGTSVQQAITTLTTLRTKLAQGQVTIPDVVAELALTTTLLDEPPIEKACCGAAREILLAQPCACPKDRSSATAMGAPDNPPKLHTFFLLPLPLPDPGKYEGSDAQKQGAKFDAAAAAAQATGAAYGTGDAQTATQAAGAEMAAENSAMAGYAEFAFSNMLPPNTPPEVREKITKKMEECKKKKGKPWEYNECLAELMQMLADALPKPGSRFKDKSLPGATVHNTLIAGDRAEIAIPVAIYATRVCATSRKAIGFAGKFVVQEPIEPITTSQGGEEAGPETPHTYCVQPFDVTGKTSVSFEVEVIPFVCDKDKITWEAPSGDPKTGNGTSFSSKFPAGRFEVSVRCGASKPLRIKVHIIGEFLSLTADTNAVCVGKEASLDVRAVVCEIDKRGNAKAVNVSREAKFEVSKDSTGKVDIKVNPKTGVAQVKGVTAGKVTIVATAGGQSDEIDLDVLGSETVAIVPSHGIMCLGHWIDFDVVSFDDECKVAQHEATWSLAFTGSGRGGISTAGEFNGTATSSSTGDITVKATIQSGTGTPVVVTPAVATVLGVTGLSPKDVFECLPSSGKLSVAFSAKTTPLDRPNKLRWKVLPNTASPSAAQGNTLNTTFTEPDRYTVLAFCGSASQATFVNIVLVKLALPGGDAVFIEDTNLIPNYTPIPADVSVEGDANSPAIALSLSVTGGGTASVVPRTATLRPGQTARIDLFGRTASGARGDTFLQALGAGAICASIPFTVVGIDKVEWDTVKAGNVRQSGVIDGNNPASHGGGHRIFPGSETPNDQLDRARVVAVVKIAPPIDGIDVHVALADPDDPTIDTHVGAGLTAGADHDKEDRHRDNFEARAAGAPAGDFSVLARANGTTDASGEFRVTFAVSLHPGDNYRAVAAAGSAPQVQAVQGPAQGSTAVRRLRADASSTYPEGGAPTAAKTSALLAVWRVAHVEFDTMAAVVTADGDAESNFTRGTLAGLTDADGDGTPDRAVLANVRPTAIDDGSPHLGGVGASLGNGRFERGTLRLGAQAAPVVLALDGNDSSAVRRATGFVIPFTLVVQNAVVVTGVVRDVTSTTQLTLGATSGTFATTQDVGSIVIGGQVRPIVAGSMNVPSGGATVVLNVAAGFDAELRDDDLNSVLPLGATAPATTAILTEMDRKFGQAFVRHALDTGASGSVVPFQRNTPPAQLLSLWFGSAPGGAPAFQTDGFRRDTYWVVYLMAVHQSTTAPTAPNFGGVGRADRDPDGENALLGISVGVRDAQRNPVGTIGSVVFREETLNEYVALGALPAGTSGETLSAAHEVGHQYQLQHPTTFASLMSDVQRDLPFHDREVVQIRASGASPGRRP